MADQTTHLSSDEKKVWEQLTGIYNIIVNDKDQYYRYNTDSQKARCVELKNEQDRKVIELFCSKHSNLTCSFDGFWRLEFHNPIRYPIREEVGRRFKEYDLKTSNAISESEEKWGCNEIKWPSTVGATDGFMFVGFNARISSAALDKAIYVYKTWPGTVHFYLRDTTPPPTAAQFKNAEPITFWRWNGDWTTPGVSPLPPPPIPPRPCRPMMISQTPLSVYKPMIQMPDGRLIDFPITPLPPPPLSTHVDEVPPAYSE